MNEPRDDNLESDLDALKSTYRAQSSEVPPYLVDQAILNKARHSLESPIRRPWSFGWIHGLTTAAIIVLGFAIYLHQPMPEQDEAIRVFKQPSPKLRDTESMREPLRIPSESAAAEPDQMPVSRAAGERSSLKTEAAPATLARAKAQVAEAEAEEQRVSPLAAAAPAPESLSEDETGMEGAEKDAATEQPGPWLERILEMRRQGLDVAAAQELAAFRATWPDYPLPAELND